MRKWIILIPHIFISFGLFANTTEYYFRFPISNRYVINKLTTQISIDKVVSDTIYAYANEEEFNMFKTLGYHYELLPHPGGIYDHDMTDDPLQLRQLLAYPTYQGYLQTMQNMALNYPSICRLDTFGYSVNGRLLLNLIISDSVHIEETEPEFYYTSTMHGDETVGYAMLLQLADYLLTNYGQTNSPGHRITHLVDNMEIWINPLFNPDGTYHAGNHTVTGATRGNANGVDLNRNFPDRINDPNNTPTGREPETQAMMVLASQQNFIMSANFHGGAQVVNYPWDNGAPSGSYSAAPDDPWLVSISETYATPNPDLMNGGFPNGITNGCQWYAIFGGRQDWIYYFEGGREVTIELWDVKNPPASVLPQRWENNKESLIAYMEDAFRGIRGSVVDAQTGLPVLAQIDIISIPNAPVYSDPHMGDFYRLLLPGTYSLIARANHYIPDTINNVAVSDSPYTDVMFQLNKQPQGVVHGKIFLSDTTHFSNIKVTIDGNVTYTNTNGYFSFSSVYGGSIQVYLEKEGYTPLVTDTIFQPPDSLWLEATLHPKDESILIVADDDGLRSIAQNGVEKENSPHILDKITAAAAELFRNTLENQGYRVSLESSSATDPGSWENYGMIIWSSGANLNPISNSQMVDALIQYVNSGGNLIIEGGEIGYDHRNNVQFINTVLHISAWISDNAGNLQINNPAHPVAANLPSTLNLTYSGYGDQDAATPMFTEDLIIMNTNLTGTAGLIANGNNIYMAFNISALDQPDAVQLIRNSAQYILPHVPIQTDLAIYDIPGLRQGDMLSPLSPVSFRVVLKNYGEQAQSAGIPVESTISNGYQSQSYQASTTNQFLPGDTMWINLGEWLVPDTLSEWNLEVKVTLNGDEIPSNNQKNISLLSLSPQVIYATDFEQGLQDWTVISSDTMDSTFTWNPTSYPVYGGWNAAWVVPRTNGVIQNEWLISPQIHNPDKLYFYWDFGNNQITNNELTVLISTTDSTTSAFTDTLLFLGGGQTYFANGFNEIQEVDLSTFQNHSIYAAFNYQGINGFYWAIDNVIFTKPLPTLIEVENQPVINLYSLHQNYPNPFNPATSISFSLASEVYVSLIIYNILGEKVITLVSEVKNRGNHQIYWNANKIASGVYFYDLTVTNRANKEVLFHKTRKMILLR